MSIEELLRRGEECEAADDLEGARSAYQEADELGSAEGSMQLGIVLRRLGDVPAGEDAFRRAEQRGHPEAANSLGSMLWDLGDLAGAKTAFARAISAGSGNGSLNLGLLFAQEGEADQALPLLRESEAGREWAASYAIGCLLEDRDDLWGAEAAYRRAAEAGNAKAAYGLGSVLMKFDEVASAREALEKAEELGHAGAAKVLEAIDGATANAMEWSSSPAGSEAGQRSGAMTVILTASGEQNASVIKLLRKWIGVTELEAQNLIAEPPSALPLNLARGDAERLVSQLVLAGATAEIVGESGAPALPHLSDPVLRIQATTNAAMAVADQARDVVCSELNAMAEQWRTDTAVVNELLGKQAAYSAIARSLRKALEDNFGALGSHRLPVASSNAWTQPEEPLQLSGETTLVGGKWAITQHVVDRMNSQLREALAASREARAHFFGGQYEKRAERAATQLNSTVRRMEAVSVRLKERAGEAESQRATNAARARLSADQHVEEVRSRLPEVLRRLPPAMSGWDSPSWESWSPVLSHPYVLLGQLRAQVGLREGENLGFASGMTTPSFVSTRDALELRFRRADRPMALALGRSLLLRALASTPAGKLELSVFDPAGLGQSVASLLELGEYDRTLIGGKVWSSTDDLQRLLKDCSSHIELVIQKYLRAEYETIEEFNAAAGQIAEPYRLLVIVDAPTGFDERTFAELRRIIENGPRCGVATLMLTDQDLQAPHGVVLDALPENLRTIWLGMPFGHESGVDFELIPSTDEQASPALRRSIVEQIGAATRTSTSSAVSFDKTFAMFSRAAMEGKRRELPRLSGAIDPADPDTWWRQSTLERVAAPIGQRGARDVATLTFDSSDHSGALLVGRPGSGKSTLLHTFIAGVTTMYGPEELELHLIDFREGVEFKVYAAGGLPHARTVAIESDREFGLSVLQTLQAELAWRGSLLRGSAEAHSSLETLRAATGERLPRIVLVFDEFQVLFARSDRLGAQAAEALETLIRQGRGFGVHVLLGSQSLSGLDALGSHVPQLLPVRILLPASDSDVFKVLGERNTEGTTLTAAGEGILNAAQGAVEANERFRGALIDEPSRRARVAAMRAKADAAGFARKPVVFEGNAPTPAADTPPGQFADEIRGADARTLRLRFGSPMAITGSADINLRREAGGNVLLVARDAPIDVGLPDPFSVPRAVTANLALSAVAQGAAVEVIDFLPLDEGIDQFLTPLIDASLIRLGRRRQTPDTLARIREEVRRRVEADDVSGPAILLVLFGMHRARDFDQDSLDFDADADLGDLLQGILRDGPEVGVHTFMWFETLASISRRLPSGAVRELAWRLAGKMSADDSASFIGVDGANSLREQQLVSANEDRGIVQRCTTIAVPPSSWIDELLAQIEPRTPAR